MTIRHLDPRFRLAIDFVCDPDASPKTREAARRQAEIIAGECDHSFEEALGRIGRSIADLDRNLPPREGPKVPAPLSVHRPAAGANDVTESVAAALIADPSKSDREIARSCRASPTTVGKLRASMGLVRLTRTVSRGGQTYEMAVGERS